MVDNVKVSKIYVNFLSTAYPDHWGWNVGGGGLGCVGVDRETEKHLWFLMNDITEFITYDRLCS